MRDHRSHNVAILGGMWGAKLTQPQTRVSFGKAFTKMLKDKEAYRSRKYRGIDQNLLKRYIW